MDYIELTAKIIPLEVGREILIAELAEFDFESFVDTEDGVQAYIQVSKFREERLADLKIIKQSNFNINYTIKTIVDKNWNEVWEKSFDPINVDNQCYIRAPFHEQKKEVNYDIVIEPKMSFGTGHHETTFLMTQRLLSMDVSGKDLLDMGCGTGVLAILAKLKNANNVVAVDNDEWAFENTLENIKTNNQLAIDVRLGGSEKITGDSYDVIIANINRNILLQNMEAYSATLKIGGSILFSGFYSSDVDRLMDEAKKNHLTLNYTTEKNDWTLLHLIKEK
jgi:ribosomal protein L11 methyltransferase